MLPAFEGWLAAADFVVTLHGACFEPFTAALDFGKNPLGAPVTATVGEPTSSHQRPFSLALTVPLRLLRPHFGTPFVLGLVLSPGNRLLPITKTTLVAIAAKGPEIASLDLLESTDSALFDAQERRLFDLQNPEEGLWLGTGKWRLRLVAEWVKEGADVFSLDPRPSQITHAFTAPEAAGALVEDTTRRVGSAGRTETELLFDSGHPALLPVPQEGRDVPLELSVEHAVTFAGNTASLVWHAPLPVRVRDPLPLLKTFQRLSAVGIDFGTTATVAALYQKGYRSLLRLGSSASSAGKKAGNGPTTESAENPAYLLIEDHERLWAEMDRDPRTARFPHLLRVVRGSHAAYEARAAAPNAVIGELKSLPERILNLDHSPQLRDRERQRDFLLDEARVRVLIRTYAYLLGRAINRPGQDVYLHYRLTHPAKFDDRSRQLLEDEIRNGILLSIPQGIPAEEISVEMAASEPEAFAAEVCPELAAHPALEPLISQLGEMRFAVFDLGGGSLDIACGRFRPATEEEQEQFGSSTVIETLQVSGDDHLGGEFLTHELVWLAHQNEKHLPEMEEKEVPMMRPVTVPPNTLANKPFLYKRSLAGRQNRVRFERELGLEAVKHGPENKPKAAPSLTAARLDGSEIALTSFGSDMASLTKDMQDHLTARIRGGVKLMKSTLGNAAWGRRWGLPQPGSRHPPRRQLLAQRLRREGPGGGARPRLRTRRRRRALRPLQGLAPRQRRSLPAGRPLRDALSHRARRHHRRSHPQDRRRPRRPQDRQQRGPPPPQGPGLQLLPRRPARLPPQVQRPRPHGHPARRSHAARPPLGPARPLGHQDTTARIQRIRRRQDDLQRPARLPRPHRPAARPHRPPRRLRHRPGGGRPPPRARRRGAPRRHHQPRQVHALTAPTTPRNPSPRARRNPLKDSHHVEPRRP